MHRTTGLASVLSQFTNPAQVTLCVDGAACAGEIVYGAACQ